jgi:hypothetical protein
MPEHSIIHEIGPGGEHRITVGKESSGWYNYIEPAILKLSSGLRYIAFTEYFGEGLFRINPVVYTVSPHAEGKRHLPLHFVPALGVGES